MCVFGSGGKDKLSSVHKSAFQKKPNIHILEKTAHSVDISDFELNTLSRRDFVLSSLGRGGGVGRGGKEMSILFM